MTRRRRALLTGAGIVVLASLAIVYALLQPGRVTSFVLARLGNALGLEITATGDSDYTLRGSPALVIRNVVVREPGAAVPLLRAQRIFVSVPWSTVRSRGETLDITRIEIEAPRFDVPALLHWLATRPLGRSTLPTLRDGLQVGGGRIDGDGWRIDGLSLALPRLQAGTRVAAHLMGRLTVDPVSTRFDLHAAMTRPANDAGIALVGPIDIRGDGWRVATRLQASAPLHVDDAGARSVRLRLALDGRYEVAAKAPTATAATAANVPVSATTSLPFAFAITSAMRYRDGTLSLAPAGIAVRGDGLLANADAHGALAYGRRLLVGIAGRLATWPERWPALPPPIGESKSPIAFSLRYLGRSDLSDPASIAVQRDATRFDGRLRGPELARWSRDASGTGSPLPPISGRLVSPRIDVSGAQLEGVEVTVEDDADDRVPAP